MAFELFEREEAVIAEAKALIESGAIADANAAEEFAGLLDAYGKLFRTTRRLVRLSDRNEEELNKLAR